MRHVTHLDALPSLASCAILYPAMKLLFALTVLVLVAASLFADYKWKQWIAARKRERGDDPALRS